MNAGAHEACRRSSKPCSEGSSPSVRSNSGPVAQLGERLPCKQEAVGSIPTRSTKSRRTTGADPRECRDCSGFGYTRGSATLMSPDRKTTLELGYGCVRCRGLGRLT